MHKVYMDDWVYDEFVHLSLGDVRVDMSDKRIISKLAAQPGAPITQAFETNSEANFCYNFFHNGKVTKGGALPTKPPILSEFIILIAILGGYLNRKNDPPPGPTVMWRGYNKMQTLTDAWESFGHE